MEWKLKGNEHFVRKDYEKALTSYNQGLEELPGHKELLANRSAVYLNLNHFHRALEDVNLVLSKDPHNVKCLYRKIKALSGLSEYSQSLGLLLEVEETLKPHDGKLYKEAMERLTKLQVEKAIGCYDFCQIVDKSFEPKDPRYFGEIANDYICPVFDIVPGVGDGTRGRGLVAIEDIKAGTLIMACAPVAMTPFISFITQIDPNEALVKMLCEKLTIEPERGQDVYILYAGKEMEPMYLHKDSPNLGQVQMERVRNIVKYNSFDHCNNFGERKVGLWTYPALLNNDCCNPNCKFNIYGDFMFIRTIRDVAKGQELTHTYTLMKDFDSTNQELQGFLCTCPLCLLEDVDRDHLGDREKQTKILKTAEQIDNFEAMEQVLEERLAQIPHKLMALRLIPWYLKIGNKLFAQKNFARAIVNFDKLLKIIENTGYATPYSIRAQLNYLLCLILQPRLLGYESYDYSVYKCDPKVMKLASNLRNELEIHFGTYKVIEVFHKWSFYKGEMGAIVQLIEGQ